MSNSQNQGSPAQDTTDYIRSATFTRPDGPSGDNAVTASDLLMGAYDPTKLHPLADLGDKLDYLLLDDDKTNELPGAGTAIPSRGWSDDLCYGTGTMYLSGKSSLSVIRSCQRVCLHEASFLSWGPLSPYLKMILTILGCSYCSSLVTCLPRNS